MGGKGVFCARREPPLARGHHICLEGRRLGRKRWFSCQRGAFPRGRGATSAWKGPDMEAKGVISYQRKAFAGGMGPYLLRMLPIHVQKGAF